MSKSFDESSGCTASCKLTFIFFHIAEKARLPECSMAKIGQYR